MTQRVRDFLIWFAAVALGLCLGGVLRQFIGMQWDAPIFVGVLFLSSAIVKVRWPQNVVMSGFSWRYMTATFVLFAAISVLLSDLRILRYWSIPAAVCLFLAYCVVHMMFGPRGDDARRRSR
jgi:hypothetical protein